MANLEESLKAIERSSDAVLKDLGAIGMAEQFSLNVMGLSESLRGVTDTDVKDGLVVLETMAAVFKDLWDLYPGAVTATEAVMAYLARQRNP